MRRWQVRGDDYRGVQRLRRHGGDSITSEGVEGGGGVRGRRCFFPADAAKGPSVIVPNHLQQ
jgi:hypothetical protein